MGLGVCYAGLLLPSSRTTRCSLTAILVLLTRIHVRVSGGMFTVSSDFMLIRKNMVEGANPTASEARDCQRDSNDIASDPTTGALNISNS
jgi:hypothetical protein